MSTSFPHRILFATQDFPPATGGIQTYSRCLAESMAKYSQFVSVLAPKQKGDTALDVQFPVPVHRMPTSSDLMRLTALPWLCAIARTERIDTVLTGNWYVAAPALVARRIGLIKRVYVAVHGQEILKTPVPEIAKPLYEKHRRAVLSQVDGCFPVSRYSGQLLLDAQVPESRIHVVPNGVDVDYWQGLGTGVSEAEFRSKYNLGQGPVLGTVARLVVRKGVDTVLQALPDIAQAHPDVRYVVAGDGPHRRSLEALARQLGIADRCRFLGRVDWQTVAAVYACSTAFVMPARQEGPSVEGFGLVFREANALGRPVVGSHSGGIPDAIVHGETGLLVPPSDVKAFTTATLSLLDQPDFADQLGQNGRRLVEAEGTWDHAAKNNSWVDERSIASLHLVDEGS